jgi:hypothetical protein
MKRSRALALLAVTTAWSPIAHAWGADGHRAVALIAQRRLKPRPAAQLRALLGPKLDLPSLAVCAADVPPTASSEAVDPDWFADGIRLLGIR